MRAASQRSAPERTCNADNQGSASTTASDGAILIVRWGKTTREQVAAAVNAIEQVDGTLLGTVMNFVPSSRRRYSYKYNYGYGYGYNSGYGESRPKRADTVSQPQITP